MNQYFLKVICFVFCCGFGIKTLQAGTQEQWMLGSQWTQSLQDAYQKGQFNDLIMTLEERYQRGVENKEWDELFKAQKEIKDKLHDSKEQEMMKEIQENTRHYQEELCLLKKARNELLLSVAKEYPNLKLSQVIQELRLDECDELNESEDFLEQFEKLQFKTQIMHSLLIMASSGNKNYAKWAGLKEISPIEAEKDCFVIQLHEFQQMLNQSGDQESIQQAILTRKEKVILIFANRHNETYLANLGRNTKQPIHQAEKRVFEMMKKFNQKQKELIKKYHLDFLDNLP